MKKKNLPTSPDWATAPSWAKWFAINRNGTANWFEYKPHVGDKYWHNNHESRGSSMFLMKFSVTNPVFTHLYFDATNWKNSLQPRLQQ